MKTIHLFLFLSCLSVLPASGQQTNDSLYRKGSGLIYQGTKLNISEAMLIMKDSSAAYEEMSKAYSKQLTANIFAGAGGACIGWELGGALAGKEMNWFVTGLGLGLVVVSLPFQSDARTHISKAVELHNASLHKTSHTDIIFLIRPGPNGLSLALRF